jgi:RES domain-containing protein
MASRPSAARWSAWRIADGRFEPFSAVGASLVGGRWNSPGLGVIYASQSFAGAMLECLAHAGIGRVPKTFVSIQIHVPNSLTVETHDDRSLPRGWDHRDQHASRLFGDQWLAERRSAVLRVPSVVARQENNVLFNPLHPQFRRLVVAAPEAVVWDARLFAKR